MRRALIVAAGAALALAGCHGGDDDGADNGGMADVQAANVNLDAVVDRAAAAGGVPPPGASTPAGPPAAGTDWIGDWAASAALCGAKGRWHFERTRVTTDDGTACTIDKATATTLGDKLMVACRTGAMKTNETWLVKQPSPGAIQVTRTAGTEIPKPITLVGC